MIGDFSSENCPAFGPHLDERDLSTRPTVWSGKGKASQREEVWLSIVRDIGSPRSRRLICIHCCMYVIETWGVVWRDIVNESDKK